MKYELFLVSLRGISYVNFIQHNREHHVLINGDFDACSVKSLLLMAPNYGFFLEVSFYDIIKTYFIFNFKCDGCDVIFW